MSMKKENVLIQQLRTMSSVPFDLSACAEEIRLFSQAYIQSGMQAVSQNAQEDLNDMMQSYRRLRREIANLPKTEKESILYECGIFNGSYRILEEINRVFLKQEEERNAQKLLERRHVPELLKYLYENPDARQRKIAEGIYVSPSYLSEILTLLMQASYVVRYGKNKNTRYSLTRAGKAVYRKRFMKEEAVTYIDTDYKEILAKDTFIRERTEEYGRDCLWKEADYEKCKENFRTFTDFAVNR